MGINAVSAINNILENRRINILREDEIKKFKDPRRLKIMNGYQLSKFGPNITKVLRIKMYWASWRISARY